MRTVVYYAASVAGTALFAPTARALVARAPSSSRCESYHQKRGSFYSGVGTSGVSAGWAAGASASCRRPQGVGRQTWWTHSGELSMSSTLTQERKLPWADESVPRQPPDEISAQHPLRVVIAGGGVGGLLAAKYLKMQGYDVSSLTKLYGDCDLFP